MSLPRKSAGDADDEVSECYLGNCLQQQFYQIIHSIQGAVQLHSSASRPATTTAGGDDAVRELISRLPPVPPVPPKSGAVTTETVTKTTFSETTVKRVTTNAAAPAVEVGTRKKKKKIARFAHCKSRYCCSST